jgi:MFS family permease
LDRRIVRMATETDSLLSPETYNSKPVIDAAIEIDDGAGDRLRGQLCQPLGITRHWLYRWSILVITCFLTFGSYACYDTPGALVVYIQNDLHVDSFQYNLLYSVYSWPNTILVFFGGILVDKLGTRVSGLIFTSIVLVGQCIYALGATIGSFDLMIFGRFVFGLGGESLAVVQSTITSHWFSGNELAMAFGITISASRLGSVFTFNFMPTIATYIGLAGALWVGAILCVMSFGMAVLFCFMDFAAFPSFIQKTPGGNSGEPPFRFKDILDFPFSFWLLTGICVFSYCGIFPFTAIAVSFIATRYGTPPTIAGPITSIPYDISMVLSPILGFGVDKLGSRALLIMGGVSGLFLAHSAFAFVPIPHSHLIAPYFAILFPASVMILLGMGFSVIGAALWPSVPIVIKLSQVGTALGLLQALQNLGLALANLGVGYIKDRWDYQHVLYFFMFCTGTATLLAIILTISDFKNGGNLHSRNPKIAGKDAPEEENGDRANAEGEGEASLPSLSTPFDQDIDEIGVEYLSLSRPRADYRMRSKYLAKMGIYPTPFTVEQSL